MQPDAKSCLGVVFEVLQHSGQNLSNRLAIAPLEVTMFR